MKSFKKIILFFVFVFVIANSHAQVKNADSMVYKLFATLKAKDQKAFVALYPSPVQFQNMMRSIMTMGMRQQFAQQSEAEKEKTKNLNVDSIVNVQLATFSKPEVAEQLQNSFGKSFDVIIQKGEKRGIDWSKTKLVNYAVDTSKTTTDREDQLMASIGFKSMKGFVDFTAGDSAYQMSFDKIIYVPANGGWFGGEFKRIIRKGESFASVDPDEPVMTDEVVADTAYAPPVKKITKTKSAGGKTKVKTKTKVPARKPVTKS